jgi:enoyl-CoA hydratase/carnithine racemase
MIGWHSEGGLWTITIDRADKANALTAPMLEQLRDILHAAGEDRDVRAVILTGAGDKVFSAGADLDAARAGLATSPLWEEVSGAVAALPCLSIAALNGTVAGGAFGMVLACDIRLSVPDARFFYPVARLGFLPQPSDPGRLAALIGPARTKLLLLGGQRLAASEALAFGLVDRIVAPDQLQAQARQIAADALAGRPEVLARIKQMCPRS